MDLYEAIFERKTTRRFLGSAVDGGILTRIGRYYKEVPHLVPGIDTEIGIMDNTDGKHYPKGIMGRKAPYYLILYSEKKDRYMMNAGYIMEYLSLYLLTQGLGSCLLGYVSVPKALRCRGRKEFIIAMAFGWPKDGLTRSQVRARRHQLGKLCHFSKEPHRQIKTLLEAARLAPSAFNRQPWRFVVDNRQIDVFSSQQEFGALARLAEFDMGCMFSHINIAAEEQWLDVDMIRLEYIGEKRFANTEYVMSVLVAF